jgi:hypothetical protein
MTTTIAAADEHGQEQDGPLAEDIPNGRFGGPRPELPSHITPCTPEEQAAHFTELAEAVSSFAVGAAIHRYALAPRPGRSHTT